MWSKLLNKILSLDKDMRFAELQKRFCKVMVTVWHNQKVGVAIMFLEKMDAIQSQYLSMSQSNLLYVRMVKEVVESEGRNFWGSGGELV